MSVRVRAAHRRPGHEHWNRSGPTCRNVRRFLLSRCCAKLCTRGLRFGAEHRTASSGAFESRGPCSLEARPRLDVIDIAARSAGDVAKISAQAVTVTASVRRAHVMVVDDDPGVFNAMRMLLKVEAFA